MSKDPWATWHKGGDLHRFVEGTIVPKSFLPAVGFVIVAFSRLDVEVDITVAHFLGYEDNAKSHDRAVRQAIAEAIPNYFPRIALLKQLVNLIVGEEKELKKLTTVIDAIHKVTEQRHRLVHDEFTSFSWSAEELNMSRKGPALRRSPTLTKPALKELGCRITDLTYQLQRYRKGDKEWGGGAQFPWRDRPLGQSRKPSRRPVGGRS